MTSLPSDNLHFLETTSELFTLRQSCEVNCKTETYTPFIRDSLAEATRSAYLADLRDFKAWGGAIPSEPHQIAMYIAALASRLSPATIERRLAAISKAHAARGLPNPVRSELVAATLRGIKRSLGVAQREAAPLLREDLFEILTRLGDRPRDVRDRALLLIGFAGALRRSELVALDREDIEVVRNGLVVTIRRSKTDQLGYGRKIGIAHGRTRWCPVTALEGWLALARIDHGGLFRNVDRHSRVSAERLTGRAVSLIVKERVSTIGLDPAAYSGHSLRAGLATSAAQAGVSSWAIRKTTGHRSDAMLGRYIRDGSLFTDNAAAALL